MKHMIKSLVLAVTTLSLMACGGGFKDGDSAVSKTVADDSNNNNDIGDTPGGNNGSGNSNNPDLQKAWTEVADGTEAKTASATGTSGLFMPTGTFVVRIDKARQGLQFIIPIPASFNIPIVAMPIPSIPGGMIEQVFQPDGSKAMGVLIPLSYMLKDSSFGDYGTLPNGSPVPFLPFGKVHGFALSFPQNPNYRLHLYMAVNGAAVFIETPHWQIPSQVNGIPIPTIGFPLYNKNKTQQVAFFAVVPNQGVYSSGIYIASRIPDQMAALIDDLIRF